MNRLYTNISIIFAGIALISLAILASDANPISAFAAFINGAFGGAHQINQTIGKALPLLIIGLGISLALKAGLLNIGAEGQLLMGGLMGAFVGYSLHLPAGIHLIVVLLAGSLVGGLWALPAIAIKLWRCGHEVISTIMLNYIAANLINYLLNGPMQADSPMREPKTPELMPTAWMPSLPFSSDSATLGLVFAILLSIGLWVWLSFTSTGYELKAVGANPDAAQANGISVKRGMSLAFLISGALAGMAGALQTAIVPEHRFYKDFSPGWGFDGLAVALLACSHPLWVIPAAILFGSIDTGCRYMESVAGVPRDIAVIIRGLVILLVAISAWRKKSEANA